MCLIYKKASETREKTVFVQRIPAPTVVKEERVLDTHKAGVKGALRTIED